MIRLALKGMVVVSCAYEVGMILTRGPTISILSGRHRWLPPLILGGLAAHLYQKELHAILGNVLGQVARQPCRRGRHRHQPGPGHRHRGQVGRHHHRSHRLGRRLART